MKGINHLILSANRRHKHACRNAGSYRHVELVTSVNREVARQNKRRNHRRFREYRRGQRYFVDEYVIRYRRIRAAVVDE